MALGRRELLIGGALAAGGFALSVSDLANGDIPSPDDIVLGRADAPVTLIEYASTTCPHCAEFHRVVWDRLKANYIDTGRLRYVFREFPTPPEVVAVAEFQIARCGGASPEQYMTRVGDIFRQQHEIIASGTLAGVRLEFVRISADMGLSEQQMMQCINDPSGAERVRRVIDASTPLNVTSTPTLFLNARKLDPRPGTYEDLAALIDAEAAQHR